MQPHSIHRVELNPHPPSPAEQMKNIGKVRERCMHIFLFMYNACILFSLIYHSILLLYIGIYKMNNWEFENPSMLVAFTNCSLHICLKIVCFVKLIFPHIVTHGIGFVCKFILMMNTYLFLLHWPKIPICLPNTIWYQIFVYFFFITSNIFSFGKSLNQIL